MSSASRPPPPVTSADLSRASPGQRGKLNTSFHSRLYEVVRKSLREDAPPLAGVGRLFAVSFASRKPDDLLLTHSKLFVRVSSGLMERLASSTTSVAAWRSHLLRMLRACSILASLCEGTPVQRLGLLLPLLTELAVGLRDAGKALPLEDGAVEKQRATLLEWWSESLLGVGDSSAVELGLAVLEQLLAVDHTLVADNVDSLVLVIAAEHAYRTSPDACCALLVRLTQIYSQLRQMPRLLAVFFDGEAEGSSLAAILRREAAQSALAAAFANLPSGQVDEVWGTVCRRTRVNERVLAVQSAVLLPLTHAALRCSGLTVSEPMSFSIAALISQVRRINFIAWLMLRPTACLDPPALVPARTRVVL